LVKTWAPLRFKISLWLALRGATGQEIGGWDMVWKLGNYASCATKSKRWLTTWLLNSRTPGTLGTISSKCSAGSYRNWHQQPWAGGDDYDLRVRPPNDPAWILSVRLGLLAGMERVQCQMLPGINDHCRRAPSDHQGWGQPLGW
jgi:hypothetical protein